MRRTVISGTNLYRAVYTMPGTGSKEFVRLVVAQDAGEVETVIENCKSIELVERDISLSVPPGTYSGEV
jgi:hypothetical protein